MRHSHRLAIFLLASLPLISCTTPAINGPADTAQVDAKTSQRGAARFADDPRLGPEIESACFSRNIRGFSDNTEDTVVLRRSPNVRVLAEIHPSCIDLEDAKTIALAQRQRCIRPGDQIFVSRFLANLSDGDFTTGRCTITALYDWDHDAKPDTPSDPADTP